MIDESMSKKGLGMVWRDGLDGMDNWIYGKGYGMRIARACMIPF